MERIPELDALLNEHGAEIMVSFQDSVDSGNCISGTETCRRELLTRLGLPPHTLAVAAGALLASRDDPLTRRAARAAALRWASLRTSKTSAAAAGVAGTGSSGGYGDKAGTLDNYPAYGNKALQPTPPWLIERVPELDALLIEHGPEIMVNLQDSVDSGNCISGTETFRGELLARHGLPPDARTVTASVLLADLDDPLTRRAARAAALRFRREQTSKTPAH